MGINNHLYTNWDDPPSMGAFLKCDFFSVAQAYQFTSFVGGPGFAEKKSSLQTAENPGGWPSIFFSPGAGDV